MHYVVIPTYQERDNVGPIVRAVLGLSLDFRAIVVDDESTDGTQDKLRELEAEFGSRLIVIHRAPPRSFSGAYIDGFTRALQEPDCTSVIECDADGSHPADRIPELVRCLENADLAIGSRYVEGGNIGGFSKDRLVLSSVANRYIGLATGIRIRDITAGFVAYRSDFLKCIPFPSIASNGYAFQIEMKWLCTRASARVREIPITFIDRSRGKSKMSFHTIIEAFQLGLRYWGRRFSRNKKAI